MIETLFSIYFTINKHFYIIIYFSNKNITIIFIFHYFIEVVIRYIIILFDKK